MPSSRRRPRPTRSVRWREARRYQFGYAGVDPSMGGGGFQGGSFSVSATCSAISSWWGWRLSAGPQRGSDLRYTLEVSLEDAVRLDGRDSRALIAALRGLRWHRAARQRIVSCGSCGDQSGPNAARFFQHTCPTCRGRGNFRPCVFAGEENG